MRSALAAVCLVLGGCATVAPNPATPAADSAPPSESLQHDKAIVHFHGAAEQGPKQLSALKWGLLFTRDDLVAVKEDKVPGKPLVNSPRYFEAEFLNRMATVKGIPNGETRTFALDPGVYDWLVLIDIQGDGVIDGFLGTQASQGPLAGFEFRAGHEYFIGVDADNDLTFRIAPDEEHPDDGADAPYLALMDSVGERLLEVDDAMLKEYVELVVEEIDALRKVKGDLCYEIVQSDDRHAIARAFDALPPRLKVRESAIIDRILRAPREEREMLDDDEAAEAMEPLAEQLRGIYGDDVGILDDAELFEQNKDLGCRIHRDLLALTLRLPIAQAAPIWRYIFSGDDDDDEGDDEKPPVMNI